MKDFTQSLIATAVIQLAGIVSGIVLARVLLPEGRGELAAVMLWPGLIASIGFLGIADAAGYLAARQRENTAAVFAAAVALCAALSLPLMAIGAAVVPLVYGGYGPAVREAGYLYLLFIPLTLFSTTLVALFQGTLRVAQWNLLRAVVQPAYVVGVVACAALGWTSVAAFAAASLAANVVTLAAILWAAARLRWVAFRPERGVISRMLGFGLRAHLGFLGNLAAQRLDQALISLILAAADFGLYVVAVTLAGGAVVVANTLGTLAFPKIASQQTEGGKAVVFGRYLRAAVVLFVPGAAVLAALAPWLVRLLFGAAFAPAAPVVRVLVIAALFLSVKMVFTAALKAYDRALVAARAELVGLVVLAASLAVLLPRYGLIGAAWAQVVVAAVATLYMGWGVRRDLGLALGPLFLPSADDWRLVRGALKGLRRGKVAP